MNIIHIEYKNIHYLEKFIKNELPLTFRYFKTRDVDVIKNHVCTILYIIDDEPIGYGHIDFDNASKLYYMGVCVLELHHGKGIGNKIVSYLCNYAKECKLRELYLTVDAHNEIAINLYKKHHFKFIKEMCNSVIQLKKDIYY